MIMLKPAKKASYKKNLDSSLLIVFLDTIKRENNF